MNRGTRMPPPPMPTGAAMKDTRKHMTTCIFVHIHIYVYIHRCVSEYVYKKIHIYTCTYLRKP
jgi:hypothetical protein